MSKPIEEKCGGLKFVGGKKLLVMAEEWQKPWYGYGFSRETFSWPWEEDH